MTNKFKVVGAKTATRSRNIPKAIRLATNKLIKAHNVLKKHENPKTKSGATRASDTFACTRKKYRQTVRQHRLKDSLSRYDIFTNPTSAYSYIRSCRKSKPKSIAQLTVGDEVYVGESVCDGFYKSMTAIKQCDQEQLRVDPNLSNQFINYDSIIQLCQNKPPIPPISLAKSTKILQSLKKNVSDFYSVTHNRT